MTTPAAEPRTTQEGSPSPTSPPPSSTPSGVKAPTLGVKAAPRQTRSTSTASAPAFSGASAADSGPADPLDTGTPSASEPGRPPSGDGSPLRLRKKPLADVMRGLVLGATVAIHQALARTELEQSAGVWLMADEDEAAGVADPLASIANRHAGGALVNPDAGDLIAAGVAAAGYVISNAIKAFQLRRAARRLAALGMNPPTEQGETA